MWASLATVLAGSVPGNLFADASPMPDSRIIPSTGEEVPCVGLGSWITFNVGKDQKLLDECADVMQAFFDGGGRLIDSSPMYGSSQATIGYGLARLSRRDTVFAADKVWTRNAAGGALQIANSGKAWRMPDFTLLQVHNLVAWQAHLELLFSLKAEGRLKYVGVTTSHGSRHRELEEIMVSQPLDFVQLTYNVLDREVEKRLLPLARERGMAVIANRPFQRGRLVRAMQRHRLPDWAGEVSADSWAQLLLRFIVSHPAVTCAIPATTRVDHVRENLRAGSKPPLAPEMRQRLVDYIQTL